MLPRLEVVHRSRPVALVRPGSVVAPYAAAAGTVTGPNAVVRLASGHAVVEGFRDGNAVGLRVSTDGRTSTHRSRRFGTVEGPGDLAVTLTGWQVCVWVRSAGTRGHWQVRGRHDVRERLDVHDEEWCRSLSATGEGIDGLRSGPFGQVGLRDLRVVSTAAGAPVREDGRILLTATHAGPGFADAGHAGVWALDPTTYELEHRGDLFFRRPDRPGVYGDHAVHLLREGEEWLVAASTWGDFDPAGGPGRLRVTLARSGEDLTRGTHVLPTAELPLPTDGFRSVATWDPHLVRDGDRWLVGYVAARKFFRFHPVLASGSSLEDLALLGAATDRRATEGTTLTRIDEDWRVLASDGRDGRRGQRGRFPVFDLTLSELGALDAPYPTNLPWPTLVRDGDGWLMVTFNGRPYGGRLAGYGTHGQVRLLRTVG